MVTVLLAAEVDAQGAPKVNELTGSLSYSHPFALPAARGRFQPALALDYSSQRSGNVGFGHGWHLRTAFVERRSRARYQGKNLPRFEYWLSGTAPSGLLLPVSGVKFDTVRAGVEYRPEVADGYFGVTYDPTANAWTGTDGTGNTYQFTCVTPVCNRWHLTRVTDPDQNVTAFEYDAEGPIGALTSSARLRAIRYNAFNPANPTSTAAIGYTGKFATHVELTYSCAARSCGAAASVPMAMREEAGSIVEHQHRLDVVRVRNESAGGVLNTVAAYWLQYGTASDHNSEVLGAVAEWGGEFARQGSATRFGYGDGVDGLKTATFSLAAAQSFPWPTGFGSAAWIDVDADGRPDLAFQGSWARNVTTPGATTLSFEPSLRTGLPAWMRSGASASNADATELLLDMDGDGTLDLLNLGIQQCGAWPGMAVRFGTIGSDHNLSFGGYTCIDAAEPVAFWGQQTAYQFALRLPETAGKPESVRSDVMDLTGDGFVDVVVREVPPAGTYPASTVWRVFPGFRDATTGAIGFGAALSYVVAGVGGFRGEIDGGAAACLGGTGTGMSEQGLVDINGDGISDRVCFENTNWHSGLNDASGFRGDSPWSAGDAVPGPAEGLFGSPTYYDACGDEKKHAENVVLKDLNGDSLTDYVYYDNVGAIAHVHWNNGKEFVEGTTFSLPSYPESRYQEAVASKLCPNNTTVSEPARGVDATMIDGDGDGTLDLVMGQPNAAGEGPLFYRGSNASEAGRVVALRSITVADGARFDILYAPSSVTVSPTGSPTDQPGGGRGGAFAVVRSVHVSGPALEPNTIDYWYGDPWYGPSWSDPSDVGFRGFRESWSKDAVTSLVSHTIRVTNSTVFMGLPLVSETGPATGSINAIGAPVQRTVVRSEFAYGARSVAAAGCIAHTEDASACGSRHEPLASQYPVVRFPASKVETRYVGATAFRSSTATDLAEVDAYGNRLKVTLDPDLAPTALNDTVLIERTWYEPNPVCKNCDQIVDWRDPSAPGAQPLQSRRYEYTASGLLVREEWSEKGVTRAYNGNGTLASVTVDGDLADGQPGSTTTYTYDQPFQLRVAQEISTGTIERVNGTGEIEYVQKSIVRDTFYDSLFGRISQVVGPYLVGSSASKPQVAYAFDDLGRVASISRSVPNGSQVADAVQIFEYDDEAVPRATRAYRLAVPKAYAVGQSVPDGDDVALRIAYRDGLGRIVQVRDRLGTGIAAAAAANVSESLTGFRVSGVRILDGAGRSRVELDPLYSGSGAYQEYRAAAPADLATVGVRGTVPSYDTEGRVKCSVYQPIIGALPPVPETCTPSTIDGAGHRLATAFTYQASTRDGGTYASVTIVPPESRGVTRHFDASGRLSITEQPAPAGASVGNRVRVLRDRLGRERATVRVSSDDSRTVESTVEYRQDGRLWRQVDPSHGTREIEYDDAGNAKLVWLSKGRSIERLRYKYGDLNRLTDVEEIGYVVQCDPGGGVCWQEERTTLTAKFGYDSPYNGDGAYAYTAGRRSYEVNAVSTIALGYDRDGRPERRDQWIGGVAGRLGTAVSHRADGAPTNVTFGMYPDASSVTHSLEYAIHYDSVGREVQLGGATTSFWAIPAQGGFGGYDASGRPGTLTADDGRATVTRTYSPFTGKMTFQAKTLGTTFFQVEGMSYLNSQLVGYTDTVNSIVYANTYDPDSGRLQQSTATATDACAPLAQDHDEQYGFNLQKTFTSGPSVGNIERVRSEVTTCDAGGALTSRATDASYGYDGENADRLNSITPQGAGDISDALPSGSESFRWDLTNRLVSISRADGTSEKLAYAGSGELVRRQLGNEVVFYVGEHATVRGTLPPSCTEPSTTCQVDPATVVVDAHVLLRSTRIASVSTSRTLFYYRDHLGSVVATSLGGGHLGAQYRYTPYGKLDRTLGENVATASELGFTGGLKLSGDLLHLRARVYHPRLKRFLSADVIDLYRYTYTLGDPVNLVDPSGLEPPSPEQECNLEAGWCAGPDGMPIAILDGITVKVGEDDRGSVGQDWSTGVVPNDPFDQDRAGDPYDGGWSDAGGGRRGGEDINGGGSDTADTPSAAAGKRIHNTPGDWSQFWSQVRDEALSALAEAGPLDILEVYSEEIGIGSFGTEPVTLSGPGMLTKGIAFEFVLKGVRNGSVTDPLTVAVTKEAVWMTGATAVRVSAAAGWGLVLDTGYRSVVTVAHANLTRDIYAVLSRGRSP